MLYSRSYTFDKLQLSRFRIRRLKNKTIIMAAVGINGFGRIGRMCLRACIEKGVEVTICIRINRRLGVRDYSSIIEFF